MPTATRPPRVFASFILILGITLAALGIRLAMLGGSPYYALTGIALIVSAFLLWRGDKRGAILYGALFAVTVAWSLYEVGFDWWALAPRVVMFAVLGLWLLIPRTRRKLNGGESVKSLWELRSTQVTAAVLVMLGAIGLWQTRARGTSRA